MLERSDKTGTGIVSNLYSPVCRAKRRFYVNLQKSRKKTEREDGFVLAFSQLLKIVAPHKNLR